MRMTQSHGLTSTLSIWVIAFITMAMPCWAWAECFQYSVSSPGGDWQGNDIGGYSAVAFNADYADPSISLGADPCDARLDTSNVPGEDSQFWVTWLELENQSGQTERIEYNYTPHLNPGDTITGRISVENRPNSFIYNGIVSVNITDFNLSDNQNGVCDILCTVEADTNQNGTRDYVNSILASEAIANHNGNVASWEQIVFPQFDHRYGDYFGIITLLAVSVPEPSTAVLLVMAGLTGVVLAGRRP